MKRITIFDTTLRDGEQAPGCSMTPAEKVRMARQLEALGVDVIEAGFPIASDDDFAGVQRVAVACRETSVAALCRAESHDIRRAAEALDRAAHPRIHTFIATSDLHLAHKLRRTRNEVLEMTRSAVRIAKSYVDDVEFSAEDATRSDIAFLCTVIEVAVAEGATVINLPDTVGYTTPAEYAHLIRTARKHVGDDVTISVHCHNDLGLAVANSLGALDAGAQQVECTINGIGERAGNAALEEIVMACAVRAERLPFATGIDTALLYPTSQLLSSIVGFSVQPNKAIVGRNAFAHEAGIHQHGVLRNPLTYEIMTPESVGVPKTDLVLGKHSGRHALAKRYEELGAPLPPSQLDMVYKRFVNLADKKKRVFDQDLLALVRTEIAS
jgi:2-isopropylmalate synthase